MKKLLRDFRGRRGGKKIGDGDGGGEGWGGRRGGEEIVCCHCEVVHLCVWWGRKKRKDWWFLVKN